MTEASSATLDADYRVTKDDLLSKLCEYVGSLLNIPPDQVDVDKTFDRMGLDSSAILALTGDLEEWLGVNLDPSVGYDYPTMDLLAGHIAELAANQPAPCR